MRNGGQASFKVRRLSRVAPFRNAALETCWFLPKIRPLLMSPVRTKVSSKRAGRKVNKPGDKLQTETYQVRKTKDFFFGFGETLTACRCSFQRRASPADTSRLPLNIGLGGVCLGSVLYAQCLCLLDTSLCFKHTFSRRTLARLSKTHNLLTKSAGQFFQVAKKKKKRGNKRLWYGSMNHIRPNAHSSFL